MGLQNIGRLTFEGNCCKGVCDLHLVKAQDSCASSARHVPSQANISILASDQALGCSPVNKQHCEVWQTNMQGGCL